MARSATCGRVRGWEAIPAKKQYRLGPRADGDRWLQKLRALGVAGADAMLEKGPGPDPRVFWDHPEESGPYDGGQGLKQENKVSRSDLRFYKL